MALNHNSARPFIVIQAEQRWNFVKFLSQIRKPVTGGPVRFLQILSK